MRVLNNKGFLLIDSLVNVLIVTNLCFLCFISYKAIDNYYEGYDRYIDESNERYDYFFNSLGECEKCVITKQEDLSPQEP